MTTTSPNARALAALGHDVRLSIFRLLVKAGDDVLRVSDIGEHHGLALSTLAHHLSAPVDAGLVLQDRQGREVFNRADFPAMRALVGFLTSECCERGGKCQRGERSGQHWLNPLCGAAPPCGRAPGQSAGTTSGKVQLPFRISSRGW